MKKIALFTIALLFTALLGTGFAHAKSGTAISSTSIEHHYNGCDDYHGHGHSHGHGHGGC